MTPADPVVPQSPPACVGCDFDGEEVRFDPTCPVHSPKPRPEPFVNERGYIIESLKSDLYERRDVPGDNLGMTWVSPLHWKVRISGSRQQPTVEIFWPDGRTYQKGENVTVSWVQEYLP